MSGHLIDQEQLFQMIKVFEGYEKTYSSTFLGKKCEQQHHDIETTIEDELREACIYIGDKQAFGKQITTKALEIFSNSRAAMIAYTQKISNLQDQIRQLDSCNHNLQDTVRLLQQQCQNHEQANQRLQRRIQKLQKSIQIHEKNIDSDKQLIKQSRSAYSELQETSILKQQTLLNQKQKISSMASKYKIEIEQQKEQISIYIEEIKDLNNKIKDTESKTAALMENKIQLESRISDLETQIYALSERIEQMEQDKTHHYHTRKYSKQSQRFSFPQGENEKSIIIQQIKNLNDEFKQTEIIFQQQDVFSYINEAIANNSGYIEPHKQTDKKSTKKSFQIPNTKLNNREDTMSRMLIDPYYAHFILTSQSVKIRLEHDEFLGINFQKYYNQVMKQGIPMHNWPQWIQKKLIQISE